jgi:hypothetical protein
MRVSKRAAVALLATAALVGSATTAMSALGHDGGQGRADHRDRGGKTLLATTLAPSVPADHALHGVAAGGAPWVLSRGTAQLHRGGRLDVRVRGLVIPVAPGNGTPGPVTTVTASLYCGNDTDTMAVGTTPSAPISRAGDARMRGTLSVPAKCLAPLVLVHPNGNPLAYIAASGFGA